MTDFTKKWEQSGRNDEYFEMADIILQDRYRLINILLSFVNHFRSKENGNRILDLGCGDGILTKYLHGFYPDNYYSVCDGSEAMLGKARGNLVRIPECRFYNYTFEEMLKRDLFDTEFDFIVSSFAIHHITHDIKFSFFEKLRSLLADGGYFINIDTCLGTNSELDGWYYALWKEWVLEQQQKSGGNEDYSGIPEKAPNKPENHYQALSVQLSWLEKAGFRNVDCHYRYGIFCIYSGQK
ncbi:MAG: class I SAM-dependent methyltransferase [Spirochaetales bacterium]|nr:class I SAM-dependent methyltransferase [Spirochaetales bacterium]